MARASREVSRPYHSFVNRRLTKRAIFLVLVVLGVVLALSIAVYWQVPRVRKHMARMEAADRLRTIWIVYQVTAVDPDGAYLPHAAVLLVENYAAPQVFLDPRGFEDSVLTVGDVDLTDFFPSTDDPDPYEWSEYQDIDKWNDHLDNAVAAAGKVSVSFYRFGDVWFMRLPRETMNGKVIFAWTIPDSDGARSVVFDNGDVATLSGGAWWPALQEDALERKRLGLLLIDPAPP